MNRRSSRAERRLRKQKDDKNITAHNLKPKKTPPNVKNLKNSLQVTQSETNQFSDDFDSFIFSEETDTIDIDEATRRAHLYMEVDNYRTDRDIRVSNNRADQRRKDIELYGKLAATGLAFFPVTFFVYLGFSKVTDAGGLMIIPALAVSAVIIMAAAKIVGFENPIALVKALGGFIPRTSQNTTPHSSISENNPSDHSS